MEPLPETAEAIAEVDATSGSDLLAELQERALLVQRLVPDCVGLSLASLDHGVTFTLVASSEDIAVLDAIQYLYGGPCVDAAHTDDVMEFQCGHAAGDEHAWQGFARATSVGGVASTLSLPILDDGRVVGTVNLYAASAQAFAGLHHAIAVIFGAWAPGAVTNADLSFSTRDIARQAPQKLREVAMVEMAVGFVASSKGLNIDEARSELGEAAQRAGVSEVAIAETIAQLNASKHDDS